MRYVQTDVIVFAFEGSVDTALNIHLDLATMAFCTLSR